MNKITFPFAEGIIIKLCSPNLKQRMLLVLKDLFPSISLPPIKESCSVVDFTPSYPREDTFQGDLVVVDTRKEQELIYIQMDSSKAYEFVKRIYEDPRCLHRFISNVFVVEKRSMDIASMLADCEEIIPKEAIVCLRAHPRTLIQELVDTCPEWTFSPRWREATHMLFVVYAYKKYHYALVRKETFAVKELVDAKFQLHLERIPKGICRAYFKLIEAFYHLQSLASPSVSSPPTSSSLTMQGSEWVSDFVHSCACPVCHKSLANHNCSAIDIGASPGGWSYFAAALGFRVASVDPGELTIFEDETLDKSVLNRIKHFPHKIEDCLQEVFGPKFFDLMLCDMNMDPRVAVCMILRLVLSFYQGRNCFEEGSSNESSDERKIVNVEGDHYLILTLKETAKQKMTLLEKLGGTGLKCCFTVLMIRKLLSNGNETTVIAKLKSSFDLNEIRHSISSLIESYAEQKV